MDTKDAAWDLARDEFLGPGCSHIRTYKKELLERHESSI